MKHTRMVRFYQWIFLCAFALPLVSCLQTEPKVLGNKTFDFDQENTSTPESFRFNFAYQDPNNGQLIYLQGANETKTTMISACNSAGTNCVCEFLDANGAELEETSTGEISYDLTGNYFRCEYDGLPASLASVRLRNQNSTVISDVYEVEETLTAGKLLGNDLDINRLRTVYRYECLHTYLQKALTTESYFDCSLQGSLCSSGSGNFCFLQTNFPYYLYSDAYANNWSQKTADKLYNQGGSDQICGLQIKQYDCAITDGSAQGLPIAQFGLYALATGIWETAVQLNSAPDASAASYGFAAKVSTAVINGVSTKVCPPGLERRFFYRATTAKTSLGVDSNYPNARESQEIALATTTPSALAVSRKSGGQCNNTTCTRPTTAAGTITTFTYTTPATPTDATEFCVIPAALLP